MVTLERFYERVQVVMPEDSPLSQRVRGHLDQIVERLLDEEQFGLQGIICIERNDGFARGLRNVSSKYQLSPHTRWYPDGNSQVFNLDNDPRNAGFIIALNSDSLENSSDENIEGLIACKFIEISMTWRPANENWLRLRNVGRRARPIKQRQFINTLPRIGSEEYERSIYEEAQRLGFSKELLAYDIPEAATQL